MSCIDTWRSAARSICFLRLISDASRCCPTSRAEKTRLPRCQAPGIYTCGYDVRTHLRAAHRRVLCVFNPREDAVFTGADDLVVLARLTRRIQALVPAGNLADNGIVSLRTRGKNQRNLGFINVGLHARKGCSGITESARSSFTIYRQIHVTHTGRPVPRRAGG